MSSPETVVMPTLATACDTVSSGRQGTCNAEIARCVPHIVLKYNVQIVVLPHVRVIGARCIRV